MKFYSEKTKKLYDTEKDLANAEATLVEKEAKEAEKLKVKKEKAKAIEEAYQKIKEAQKEYYKLRDAFIDEYGSFHMTYTDKDKKPKVTSYIDEDLSALMLSLFGF